MGVGKILGVIADALPFGSIAKSLVRGAGSLLFKKAAKAIGVGDDVVDSIFVEAEELAENDHEIRKLLIDEEKERRAHELAFFGKFSELDGGGKKLRSLMRPMVTLGLVGFYLLGLVVALVQQIFPQTGFRREFMYIHPDSLVEITKWIVAFWFSGRTIEKIAEIVKR